jgi:hypothetical protein
MQLNPFADGCSRRLYRAWVAVPICCMDDLHQQEHRQGRLTIVSDYYMTFLLLNWAFEDEANFSHVMECRGLVYYVLRGTD